MKKSTCNCKILEKSATHRLLQSDCSVAISPPDSASDKQNNVLELLTFSPPRHSKKINKSEQSTRRLVVSTQHIRNTVLHPRNFDPLRIATPWRVCTY
jgi:hypothetical protein